jgi:excisionase family DNA binding protein
MPPTIPADIKEIRRTLEVLEAAYFSLVDRLEARTIPLLLPKVQAAKVLGVGKSALQELIASRKIRVVSVNGRAMVARAELERFAWAAQAFETAANRRLLRRPRSIDVLRSVEVKAADRRRKTLLQTAEPEKTTEAARASPPT